MNNYKFKYVVQFYTMSDCFNSNAWVYVNDISELVDKCVEQGAYARDISDIRIMDVIELHP